MRYPESKMSLDSAMPTSSIQAWLGQELETRGIDAMIYTRYILSILQQDSFEFEHIESDLFPMKKDLVQGKKEFPPKGKTRMKKGDRRWSVDGEEMKKTVAVECLMSVSDVTEKDEGLKKLVEETYRKLKEQQHLDETTCEVPGSVCVSPVARSASPRAPAAVPSPPIPAVVCVPDVEESLMKEELNTTREGYYDAFPALLDKDGTETPQTPKEKSNTTVMTVWHKKNAKLSPATSDVEHATPSELNQERPASNPQLRRSQSRGSSGESDEGQKGRKPRHKSRDHGTSSPGQDQRKPDHEINKYGSKSAESYSKGSRGPQRSHSHSQRYRSKSQEKFSGGRNKYTPRPYVFYKLKSNRDPKGQFGKDVHQPGRNRGRQPGAAFFTPRYPISPAKLGKAPKFSDSLKITDDILRLLHVRPEQEQWFDDLVSGTFPRHPIRVGHHPRKPRDDNDDDLFLYDGPIETVFPPSETRQGRLYERHSCSSVDDLVMAAHVTDTVTTVDTTDTQKSSRFLPFILSKDDEKDLDDFNIRLSLSMIEKDSEGSEDESTPRQEECQQLAADTDALVPELVKTESSYSEDQCCKLGDVNLNDRCRKLVVSSCDSDDTLKTSSSSDSESTEEDEYDFNRFTEFIENKKKGMNGVEALSDGMTDKSRSEKLALQIDGAQSRGISLLRELQPENSDWLRGDEESSGSDNEQRCSPSLAKEVAVPSFEMKDDLLSGANEQTENLVTEKETGSVQLGVESEEKSDGGRAGKDADAVVEEFNDKDVIETVLDVGTGGNAGVEATCADPEPQEGEIPKTQTDQQEVVTHYEFPEIAEIKPDDEEARHDVADLIDLKVSMESKKSYIDGLEEMFEKLGVFGKAIGNICDEIKKIEDVSTAADDVEKIELPILKTEDSEPSDVPLLIQSDVKVKRVDNLRKLNNLTVDAALSNKLQGSTQDTSTLSPNRSRLDGFPTLLPKEEDVPATVAADEADQCIAKNFVNIDLQAEDGFAKLQELSTFLEFRVEDIKELLPQEECSVVSVEDTEVVEDVVALEPKSTSSLKSNVPRYLSDNKQNESVVLSQSRATESSDDDVKMQVFTVPASSFKQMGDVFLTKDDVVVRIANNDSSDEDATDESDTESTSTTTGSDGYSEILGDLDSILAGINISSEDITADMAENSVQFLEDLKLLDESLDTSTSTDENSGSDAACHGDAWTVSDEDAKQFPSSQTEPVHSGLQLSLSDTSDHGELPQPEPEHPRGVIGCDNAWSISENEIQTKQYKRLSDNQQEQIQHHSLHRSQSERKDLGLLPLVHCSSEVMGHDTWSVTEDTVRQSNNNFGLNPGLHRSRSDHSDILGHGDTWSVSEEDTIQTRQLNNNQSTLSVIPSGLHRSSSSRSDHGLLPPVININSNLDVLNTEVTVRDHDRTADSGISQYAEENCEMAENIALATCGNLSSDGDSCSEMSDSPCLDSPEQTPLAKHIAALTRRRHPGIGKKWPPASAKESQDDGYGEGQVCPEQDNAKNLLQVDNEPWNRSNVSQTYLGSPRNPDVATWGSMSETTGSVPTSKDHSPWPTLDNMFSAENSNWQDRSTPSLSSSSSHSMRRVDADWQSLQLNTSENTGIGEPLYVNVNDVSLDNSSDTLYYLPSLSDSPKVEDLLAEASSMLDSMDHERFHQLLVDIENQSESEADNMGDFSEALQKLAVNEGNYTVLQELDKLFQTYMHAEGLSDDDKLLMDAVDDLAQFTEQDPNRCMSPGGEEYSGHDDQCDKKHTAPGNVGQGDPTYNLWNNSGKEISGHLNWYIGGEDSLGNLNKGHSCSDIAYWSDTELIDEKPDLVIHTSASYGQLSSLSRKRSRHHHTTPGSYIGLPHSQSANLQPSEFSAFKDKIPEKMSHVRSEPHLASRSRRIQANFKSDSDLLNKTAPVITLQKETKATIGEGYNKNKSDSNDLVISPKTHFRPIHSLTHEPDVGGYNANAATEATAQAAIGTAIQHVEKPPLFSFSPDPNEDYQLFVTSDSEGETSFVPKFKVKLDGQKWSQTDKPKKGRAVGEGKVKTTGSFTDDCIETCRKKLEQCSQEILLQCKKHVKRQLTGAILEEEDLSVCQQGDDSASFDDSAADGRIVTSDEISICDQNGNIGETCSEQTEDSPESEKTDVVLSCHDRDCFCPECGLERQVAAPEPYWSSAKSFYSCTGLGMDKEIVENRDGESLQGGSVELGQNVNKFNVQDKQCCDLECKGIETDTADSCSDAGLGNEQDLGCDKRKDVEYLDIMALCNTVDLMQVGDESPRDALSSGKDEDMAKPVISTEVDSGVTSPQVPVQDVADIWAAATDFHIFTSTAEAVTKKYSIWSVGSDIGLPSLPADVSDELIIPGCFISGANNTLKEKPCSEDTTSDGAKEEPYILMEDEAFSLDQPSYDNEDFDLSFIQPPHRPRAFYSSELEEVWMRTPDFSDSWYSRRKRRSRSGSISNKPCSFYMEGNCRRADCRFSHDLSSITCRFWERGECFKGVTCPFMHAYNSSEKKSSTKPESLTLENKEQDFPKLSQESKSDDEKSS
ncbi:uncharacterized protein LOC135489819 [Lineus longissimus]|uniref:uncharacterized protein LOC135489819 n=1 Tax=Lineus longissimus TaxID=88925 RepID=UPI00315D8BF1